MYEYVRLCVCLRPGRYNDAAQWSVHSSRFSFESISSCIHRESSSLAFLEWLTFLLCPSSRFLIIIATHDFQKPGCSPPLRLPSHPHPDSFLAVSLSETEVRSRASEWAVQRWRILPFRSSGLHFVSFRCYLFCHSALQSNNKEARLREGNPVMLVD